MGVLEHLVPEDWQTARRNFERLERLFSVVSKDSDGFGFTVAGIGVRFGTGTVVFPGQDSNALTVTHGLGHSPTVIFVGNADTTGSYNGIAAYTTDIPNTTQFRVYGRQLNGSGALNKGIYWAVIG